MAKRTCTIDGCENKHSARGLCSSHYNQWHSAPEIRHPKLNLKCDWCGVACQRVRIQDDPQALLLDTASQRVG